MSSLEVSPLARPVVSAIVLDSLRDVLAMSNGARSEAGELGEDTYLIGQGAVLDSLGLVNVILEIEQRLEDEHDVTLVLADERAMSQKNSPFRSVRSLTDYICRLIGERDAGHGA